MGEGDGKAYDRPIESRKSAGVKFVLAVCSTLGLSRSSVLAQIVSTD